MSPRVPFRPSTLLFGGDYNPEHWPKDVIDEDLELMQQAGVNLVSVGIFGWATAEPRPGEYDFSFYRDILDRLHESGVGVSLATMTASPPPWLTHRHPEVLPQRADGVRLSPGARQAYCPSSPIFREAVRNLVTALATEFGDHPALKIWHLNNEYACHVSSCYCDISAAAFRDWLRERYGTIEELNAAWTTTFWSQGYTDFAEILPPREAPTFPNNAQQLDFARFSSEELQSLMGIEIEVVRKLTPTIPLTTNFPSVWPKLDLWAWADDLDVVSFDSYPDPADHDEFYSAAFAYDVIRSVGGGEPWLLMEQAPSAVNWRKVNVPKAPGRMRVGSWQTVARGSDSVLFFQWRASPGGAEKYHSGMVPHTGADSRTYREIEALGAELAQHPELRGGRTRHATGILLDWDCWWASILDSHPISGLDYRVALRRWHESLMRAGVPADFVRHGDLDDHPLLLVPNGYLLTRAAGEELAAAVEAGSTLVVNYFSGVVDERERIHPGGAPGPLRELLGVTVAEWWPMPADRTVEVQLDGKTYTATTFTEELRIDSSEVEVLGYFVSGELAGQPAVVRRAHGDGYAYYCAADLDDAGIAALLRLACDQAGITPSVPELPAGVEAAPRTCDAGEVLYLINHYPDPASVPLSGEMRELLTGARGERAELGGYDVQIWQRTQPASTENSR